MTGRIRKLILRRYDGGIGCGIDQSSRQRFEKSKEKAMFVFPKPICRNRGAPLMKRTIDREEFRK